MLPRPPLQPPPKPAPQPAATPASTAVATAVATAQVNGSGMCNEPLVTHVCARMGVARAASLYALDWLVPG
jgi:hypothetical protein